MEDVIGVLTLGVEFAAIAMLNHFFRGPNLDAGILLLTFILLVAVALVSWHTKDASYTVDEWKASAIWSIAIGGIFYGCDLFLCRMEGRSGWFPLVGGPMGTIATLLVCPVFTMISVGGLVRALYASRSGLR